MCGSVGHRGCGRRLGCESPEGVITRTGRAAFKPVAQDTQSAQDVAAPRRHQAVEAAGPDLPETYLVPVGMGPGCVKNAIPSFAGLVSLPGPGILFARPSRGTFE